MDINTATSEKPPHENSWEPFQYILGFSKQGVSITSFNAISNFCATLGETQQIFLSWETNLESFQPFELQEVSA